MDSENTPPVTKMEKIRIVVEYRELIENEKANFLKKNGLDQETFEAYQREAASAIGGGSNLAPPPPAPPPQTRCEKLAAALKSHNENARKDNVRALGAMRHRAIPVVDAVIDRMLNDTVDSVRSWSAWALTRIDPRNPSVIEAFLKGLTEDKKSLNTRNWCVVGLSVSESDQVKEQLMDVVLSGEPFAQFASIEVLSRMGVESTEFVDKLAIVAKSDNESLRALVEETLEKIQSED